MPAKLLTVFLVIGIFQIHVDLAQSCAQETGSQETGVQNTTGSSAAAQRATHTGKTWRQRLPEADNNSAELEKAMEVVKFEHRRAMQFLIENMPLEDLRTLKADFLVKNVELAYSAINAAAWRDQISEEMFLNDILPYANVDETREDWRAEMQQRCLPIVKDCKTISEAVQKLNRELFTKVNVRYSTSRKRPNQSPSESIEQSVASCTGLSILLSDACRSVGIPARLAGIPSWTNKRGNHTWVEIWDGQWQFTGACEPSDKGLNNAWFAGDAALADDSSPLHRIYASSFKQTGTHFPLVWDPDSTQVPALNVTSRYTSPKKETIATAGTPRVLIKVTQDGQRVVRKVVVKNSADSEESYDGNSRGVTSDTNNFLTFHLVPNQSYEIRIGDQTFERKTNAESQQLWEFVLQK